MDLNQKLAKLQPILDKLPPEHKKTIAEALEAVRASAARQKASVDFMAFVKKVWPNFIEGAHHRIMADAFEKIADGRLKRLIINLPPRHSKSELSSYLLPAWFIGRYPGKKIIQATHTAELSVGFGRKVRNLIDEDSYKSVFPGVKLSSDSKAAGRWETNSGGEAYYLGVGGAMTGRGADLLIIDDPHAGDQMGNDPMPADFEKAYEWYTSGPRQRLQPKGAIALIMCVAKGEKVFTRDNGPVSIEDIKPGDFVWSRQGDKPVAKRVIACRSSGEDDVIQINTCGKSLRVNKNHPLLVVRGGLKKSARTQAEVVASRNWSLEWVTAGCLNPGDTIVGLRNLPSPGHRPMAFNGKTQMTQKMYWLLGFLFGDGWLLKDKSRGIRGLCVAMSSYSDLNEKFLGIIKDEFGVTPSRISFGYARYECKKLGDWLNSIGFYGAAKTKRVPGWVFRLRPCDKRSFLRGFFAADGWLRPSGLAETYSACLSNKDLLQDLKLLSHTCGVATSGLYKSTGIVKPPHSPKPILATSYLSRFRFRNSSILLKSRYKNQGLHGNYYQFEDIKSIVSYGRSEVFDLTVEDSENFIANGLVVHNTRWGEGDLCGKILRAAKERDGTDQWHVINFPALNDKDEPLWPQFWSKEELLAIRAEIPSHKWSSQYQQDPVAQGAAIVKREWVKWWEEVDPPHCEYLILSIDPAHTTSNRADYSAFTVWGIFEIEGEDGRPVKNLILLDAVNERLEFPDLKQRTLELYQYWTPDITIVEAKAAGLPLVQELRSTGVPLQSFTPSRGNDKITRVNSIADIFSSGLVWMPRRPWAEKVIDQYVAFPFGDHDDLVDSSTQALMYYRKTASIRLPADYVEPDESKLYRRIPEYY